MMGIRPSTACDDAPEVRREAQQAQYCRHLRSADRSVECQKLFSPKEAR
jgi:hypothetical protein